jgi:hypothetical protein
LIYINRSGAPARVIALCPLQRIAPRARDIFAKEAFPIRTLEIDQGWSGTFPDLREVEEGSGVA